MAGEQTKACPWCGETILQVAKKCKHCGEYLTDERPTDSADAEGTGSPLSVACAFCAAEQPIDDDAADFRCDSCERGIYLRQCRRCGWMGQVAKTLDEWECPACGTWYDNLSPGRATSGSETAVWRWNETHWTCIEHGMHMCGRCHSKVKLPRRTGLPGDVFPGPRVAAVVTAGVVVAGAAASNTEHWNAEMVCPHCLTKGKVATRRVSLKKGISGGKATAAVLTAGISMLGTGLSRKENATEAHCDNCGSTWHIA